MTSITFHRGVNDIGGNKFLVKDKDTTLFMDFGMSFSEEGQFFTQFLNARGSNFLIDMFELGMLPKIKGLYRQDYAKHVDFDGMSDMAKDRMSDVAKDKLHDKMQKFSDQSPRLKAMIMTKHDITDERMDEIKMKFKEKHGDLTDAKKSDLKMKFKDHMKKIKTNLTDEQKSDIHDRIAEMKAFKADLRERASDLTDEEKQELRADFIEKAKDMQLAWISPRTQMTAGLDAADVECREGFSLVMKASNGVAKCLYADTALKMIDRGIVVPAN